MLPQFDYDPRDPAFCQQPYTAYAQMHAAGGIGMWPAYDMVAFARYDDVNAILRDRRFGRQWPHEHPAHLADFAATELHSLLCLEGDAHRRLRAVVSRAFVNKHIDALRPRIQASIDERLEALAAEFADTGEAELLSTFAMPIPAQIIASMIGAPREMVPDLLDWSHAMVKVYTQTQSHDDDLAANQAAREFSDALRGLIQARRQRPQDDLLSRLLQQGLDDEELISTGILLLNAGHEATVHSTGNAVKAVLESGLDTHALFAPEQCAQTVEELLRFDPPLHLFTRYVYEDMSFAGVALQRGQQVALLLGAASHDPSKLDHPERFNPYRGNAPHLGFGVGVHFCLGAPLARAELTMTLPALFTRFADLRLVAAPRYADSYHFRGLETLRVRSGTSRPKTA